MSGRGKWSGLSPEKLAEIANRYEAACVLAAQRVQETETDPAKFAARFTEFRNGIWAGVAQELRDLGCPESHAADEVANVINHAARRRALEGLPAKGRA